MFLQSRILCIYAESALHAGSGTSVGAVDLPIQREVTTQYPIIQASSIKGALRQAALDPSEVNAVFGPAETPDYAGAISPGDARILLFPVRALNGVFVWTTSADVLGRFQREAALAGYTGLPDVVPSSAEGEALVSDPALLLDDNSIVLEEFSYSARRDEVTRQWAEYLAAYALPSNGAFDYWRERLVRNLVVLPSNDFRDFVLYSTEIVTRIRVSPETKTVATGALFSQELLPADSVLYAPIYATAVHTKNSSLYSVDAGTSAQNVIGWVQQNVPLRLQIGGDETVGRGLVHLRWLAEG